MIDDDYKDVLGVGQVARAVRALRETQPYDEFLKARKAIIATGLPQELRTLKAWVEDLSEFKSGTYVKCCWCGEKCEVKRGEANRLEWFKEHVEKCEKHPLAQARKEIQELREKLENCNDWEP